MNIGLRVDVDTFRGTKYGLPNLCRLLDKHNIKATFFFSVGPDNMGRHLWRLLRPTFLWKMLRTKAASLYGWDILFKGTFWPGPAIGKNLKDEIRAVSDAGHEIGLHAWDHHAWQAHIESMSPDDIHKHLQQGVDLLTNITGHPPVCSAVPGWRCTDQTLIEKNKFQFVYNSDCRGTDIFNPVVNGQTLPQPQIPSTLPTYDEVIGQNNISDLNYNEHMLSLLDPSKLNILTIHTEAEGMSKLNMFDEFITKAKANGAEFIPLGNLLKNRTDHNTAEIKKEAIPGREGWLACQNKLEINT